MIPDDRPGRTGSTAPQTRLSGDSVARQDEGSMLDAHAKLKEEVVAVATPKPASETVPKQADGSDPQPIATTAFDPESSRTKLQTYLIVGALSSALFLSALDISIITVAIPTIVADFHSTSGYTWIGGAYLLANAATAPVWGNLSDIWGRKPILLLSVAVFWVGSLLCAVARNMDMLIGARAVQGIGGGGIIILVNICISDLFSLRTRGMYLGIMGLVWAVAGGVGPIVGGLFTDKVTWRWCFYINLPISGVGMGVLMLVLKLHSPKTPIWQGLAAVDWLGAITIVCGTLMLLLGLDFGGLTFPWVSPTVLCLMIFGLLVIGIFVIIESRFAKFPVVPLSLFTNRSNVAACGVCVFHALVFIAETYYMPLYFQAVLGASSLLSGVYILPFTLSNALSASITGIFIKKTGKYVSLIIGSMAVMTLGFGLLLDLGSKANLAKIVLYQLIAGIGAGTNFQAPLIAIHSNVAPWDIASATGTFGFLRQIAGSISVVIGGVVLQNSMQSQYPELLEQLGPDIASFLTGANAAASVDIIANLPGAAGEIARAAFWKGLKMMLIMYVALSAVGLLVSLFVTSQTLSQEVHDQQTGLDHLRASVRNAKRLADEEKAVPVGDSRDNV